MFCFYLIIAIACKCIECMEFVRCSHKQHGTWCTMQCIDVLSAMKVPCGKTIRTRLMTQNETKRNKMQENNDKEDTHPQTLHRVSCNHLFQQPAYSHNSDDVNIVTLVNVRLLRRLRKTCCDRCSAIVVVVFAVVVVAVRRVSTARTVCIRYFIVCLCACVYVQNECWFRSTALFFFFQKRIRIEYIRLVLQTHSDTSWAFWVQCGTWKKEEKKYVRRIDVCVPACCLPACL